MTRALIPILAFALGAMGWLAWKKDQVLLSTLQRVARLEGELSKRGVVIPAEDTPAPVAAPHPAPPQAAPHRESVDVGKYLAMIDQLRARAAELEKDVQEARLEAEHQREKLSTQTDDLKRAADQLGDAREAILKQQRISEALDTELKFKAQRLTQSETNEKLLQDRLAKSEQAAKRVVVTSKEVEDLNRRREASLVTLERRYREITDLYRSFSLNLQTRETPGQGLQAGDLSRIQTALQQAEEELRQLRSLNARVVELSRAKP